MIQYTGRRVGKATSHHLAIEAALDAGKTILVVNSTGATLRRRVNHLTVIETLRCGEPDRTIIYDDYLF